MINTKHIHIDDYNYPLPDERIAKFPLAQRDHSKLLLYDNGQVSEDVFCNLPQYLNSDTLMVFNNTRVIQARMHFRKATGANIEIFLLEPYSPVDYEQMFQAHGCCQCVCLVGNLKKWKEGILSAEECSLTAEMKGTSGTGYVIEFRWTSDLSFAEVIDRVGELPIPPYLNRKTEESDKTTYQTVYSKIKGSVAAPTAGLHFTPEVLRAIDDKGICREEVTLHVGAGTFKPVKADEIADHEMHSETFFVRRQTIEKLLAHNCKATAVGTTSVRTLESLYYIGLHPETPRVAQWEPYDTDNKMPVGQALQNILHYMDDNNLDALHGSTQIIIAPGYEYKIVNQLITNFHQPKSTLLLLVSAFVKGDWKTIYNYALTNDFRFLSYGDSSLLKLRD